MRNIFFLLLFLTTSLFAGTQAIIKADQADGLESVKNYMKEKAHFEKNVNGWSAYADAAATRPVDGTGGSPTITCTRSTTTPITGDGSLIITKDAANRQGQGCSAQFTIGNEMKAKVMQIEIDYRVVSGTFAAGTSTTDSDLIVYIYDVTNSTLIEPTSIKFLSTSTTIPDKMVTNFQTSATGTTYNLIIHHATTSASAFVLMLDNIKTTASRYVYGTPITDWVSYTYTGFTSSNGVMNSKWRRVGDMMEVMQSMEWSNTAGAFSGNFGIPSGYAIDTAKLPLSTIAVDRTVVGRGTALDSGLFIYDVMVTYRDTSTVNIWSLDVNTVGYGRNTNLSNTAPFTIAASDNISIRYSVPIVGWSSSTQQSDGYDGRVIAFEATTGTSFSATTGGAWTKITGMTAALDKVAGFASNTYTIKSSGTYRIDGAAGLGASTTGIKLIAIYKNGSQLVNTIGAQSTAYGQISLSKTVDCVAGDTIELYYQNYAATENWNLMTFSVVKVQGSTTISATERFSFSANTSSTAATTSSPFLFTNIVDNTHGAYSAATGRVTILFPGFYCFGGSIYSNFSAYSVDLYKGSTRTKEGTLGGVSSVSAVHHCLPAVAGDTFELRPNGNVTGNSAARTDTFYGYLVK